MPAFGRAYRPFGRANARFELGPVGLLHGAAALLVHGFREPEGGLHAGQGILADLMEPGSKDRSVIEPLDAVDDFQVRAPGTPASSYRPAPPTARGSPCACRRRTKARWLRRKP